MQEETTTTETTEAIADPTPAEEPATEPTLDTGDLDSSYTKPPSGSGGLSSGSGSTAGTAGDISGAGSGAGTAK